MTDISQKIEPIYVADTHTIIWHLKDDKKLKAATIKIFEAAERGETEIVISAITILELYYANKKWKIFPDFAEVYTALQSKPYIRIVEFASRDVLEFDDLAAVPEMHDRIIVGLAKRLDVPLMTVDEKIIAAGLVTIVQ